MRFFEFKQEDPGTFIGVRLSDESVQSLVAFGEEHAIPGLLNPADFHITIMASRISFSPELPEIDQRIVEPLEWAMFGEKKDCLVLCVRSDYLTRAHEACEVAGGVSDYPEYRPHISFSYDAAGFDFTTLPIPDIDLLLDEVYSKPFSE